MKEISVLDQMAASRAEVEAVRASGILAHLNLDRTAKKVAKQVQAELSSRPRSEGWLAGRPGFYAGQDADGMAIFGGVTL